MKILKYVGMFAACYILYGFVLWVLNWSGFMTMCNMATSVQ